MNPPVPVVIVRHETIILSLAAVRPVVVLAVRLPHVDRARVSPAHSSWHPTHLAMQRRWSLVLLIVADAIQK